MAAASLDKPHFSPSDFFDEHNQEDFEASSLRAVKEGVAMLSTDASFSHLLEELARRRQEIAVRHGTENSDQFGALRIDGLGVCSRTRLFAKTYSTYGADALERIKTVVDRMKGESCSRGSCRGFTSEKEVIDGSCGGLKTRTEVDVFIRTKAEEIMQTLDPHWIRVLKQKKLDFKRIDEPKVAQAIKAALPVLYSRLPLTLAWNQFQISKMTKDFPQTFYVTVTQRIEMDGALYALSKLMTFGNCDGSSEEMWAHSEVACLHQDRFLIERTMAEAEKYFDKAKSWTPDKPQAELVENVGMMLYLYSHAMPYQRGSAAIGEWLEKIVYEHHGFSVGERPGMKVDLTALTTLRAELFMTAYQESTVLT